MNCDGYTGKKQLSEFRQLAEVIAKAHEDARVMNQDFDLQKECSQTADDCEDCKNLRRDTDTCRLSKCERR